MRILPLLLLLSTTLAAQVAGNPSGCSSTALVDCTNGSTPVGLPVEFTVGPLAVGDPAVVLFGLDSDVVSDVLGITLAVDLGPGFGPAFNGCALFASGVALLSSTAGPDGVVRVSITIPAGYSPIVVQGLVLDSNPVGLMLTANYLHYFPN